jgi:hypothetical protein
MSKQILKSLSMLTLVAGLMLMASVVSANGQSTSDQVSADIPFDFIVANKTLPAGRYTVRAATSDGQGMSIKSGDGKSAAIILSNSVADKSKERNARMVFYRYGQQYFLAEVWSGDAYGRQLRQCKKERTLRHELALNGSKSDRTNASYQIVQVAALVR